MSLQTMEPSAEQLRIASLLEDKSSNTDLEQKIQKVIEFTGCSTDQVNEANFQNFVKNREFFLHIGKIKYFLGCGCIV